MMRCQLFVRWLAKRSCTLVRCRSHAPSSADTTSAATSDTCLMVVAHSSTSSHSEHDLASIVDLSKYPLHDQLAASELIEQAREQFLATGLVTFPGFLQPSAIKQAVEEALPQVSSAFETVQRHNVFLLEQDDDSFGQDHVRNKKLTTQVASVAYDELPREGILRRLYSSPELVQLVGGVVLGTRGGGGDDRSEGSSSGTEPTTTPQLHRLADPLGACSINVFRPGRFHDWHFDESEFTTTLCLQPAAPRTGGDFLYTAPLADRGAVAPDGTITDSAAAERLFISVAEIVDTGYDAVHSKPAVHRMEFPAGTLALFAGNRSLHCVTPVGNVAPSTDAGDTSDSDGSDNHDDAHKARLVAVLCFARQPDVRNSPQVQKLFWGRSVQQ